MLLQYLLLLSFSFVQSVLAIVPWPKPNQTARPIFHLGGLDNAPGYVGDANGMMFRNGLFHMSWQCFVKEGAGLNWCHSTSSDFVKWTPLPPMYNHLGGGAESGGIAQLENGDAVAIFNEVGGGGHWQARPINISDPHLKYWRYTHPNGTSCGQNEKCKVTPGIPGTDLSQPFKDGSNDGYWRVVADRGHSGGVTGAAMIAKTKDFLSFQVESTYHEYKWTRCVDLPAECGFGPYPRDPNTFRLVDTEDIWVFYGMQKTCSFSGREFYVLGKYVNHTFKPLDSRSDYANNIWDGGEGYASMHVYDPVKNRMIWMTAVIENDRDPCGSKDGEGFWRSWMIERDIGRGWFGTLGLPRVITMENLTNHFVEDSSTAMHLITAPLPEISDLRNKEDSYSFKSAKRGGSTRLKLSHGEVWDGSKNTFNRTSSSAASLPRSQSIEGIVQFSTNDLKKEGSDAGLRVLWDDENKEFTHVGVREGTYLDGVDLWDQVNGDSYSFNISNNNRTRNTINPIDSCRNACLSPPSGIRCTAWTLSGNNLCRFKAHAQHSLQVASDNGAFLPYHSNCISGYIHTSTIHYFSLYIDRTHSTIAVPVTNKNYTYPFFNYSKLLMVVVGEPSSSIESKEKVIEETIDLHVYVDRSIVEVFAQGGRSVVTARVYPSKPNSNRFGLYNMNNEVNVDSVQVWSMQSALKGNDVKKENIEDTEDKKNNQSINKNSNEVFKDARDISNGIIMLEQIYTDQPYCTQMPWNSSSTIRWVCVVTVNNYIGKNGQSEGGYGEHVVSIYSDNLGITWSKPVSIELAPPSQVPSAYGNIVAANFCINGIKRLYSIYNFNYDNITNVTGRNDELGYFYMKYSDDGGVSWSNDRYRVPYPQTWIDRNNNPFHGKTNIMWTVDHIKIKNNIVYFAFTKIGNYIQNPPEEIYIQSSSNLLTASNPKDIVWDMLPKNDHGITCPMNYNCNKTAMEEGHVLPLSTIPNRMIVMARTSMGYLATATRDENLQPIDGDNNTRIARYWNNTLSNQTTLIPLNNVTAENGQTVMSGVKHPRGPFTPKEIMPGIWIMLYYNNGGGGSYGRDPYFLTIGREVIVTELTGIKKPEILWSQPEIIIYDREYIGGTSGGGYPDFIFVPATGNSASNVTPEVYITTAQKALPHPAKSRCYLIKVNSNLLNGLLEQHISTSMLKRSILSLNNLKSMNIPHSLSALPATGQVSTSNQQGFTFVFTISNHNKLSKSGNIIFSNNYIQLIVGNGKDDSKLLNFSYFDGYGSNFNGRTGDMCTGLIMNDNTHHIAIVADGGPNIVSFIIDGVYCDDSWSWIPQTGMSVIPSTANFQVNSQTNDYGGTVTSLDVYNVALRTSEVISLYRQHVHSHLNVS